jgi:hypothetical protein
MRSFVPVRHGPRGSIASCASTRFSETLATLGAHVEAERETAERRVSNAMLKRLGIMQHPHRHGEGDV